MKHGHYFNAGHKVIKTMLKEQLKYYRSILHILKGSYVSKSHIYLFINLIHFKA